MQIILLGKFDPSLLPGSTNWVEVSPEPSSLIDEQGRLSVDRLLKDFKIPEKITRPVILATTRDLAINHCETLFGYSSSRRRLALISTYRLSACTDWLGLQTRFRNVLAHETGHLEGFRHCDTTGCVMNPVQTLDQLDRRTQKRCGKCPKPQRLPMAAGFLIIMFLLLYWGLERLNPVLAGRPEYPFTWQSSKTVNRFQAKESSQILFRGDHVLTLRSQGDFVSLDHRCESLVTKLNQLYNRVSHPRFEVTALDHSRAAILCNGSRLMQILPLDADGEDMILVAKRLQTQIATLICGKGWSTENCPRCHIERIDEVEQAVHKSGGQ